MEKNFLILSLLFFLLPTVLKAANICSGYVVLPKGLKEAIDDYDEHYNRNKDKMLILVYQHNEPDSVVFSLSSHVYVLFFMENPSMYYSLHREKIVLIYTGEEKEYNPNAEDMEDFVYFLSVFDNPPDIIKCDWTKKELVLDNRFGQNFSLFTYSPPVIQYHVDSIGIIYKRQLDGTDVDYPKYSSKRYNINVIYMK